ncbi:hypothetical protein niasHT_033291 [Heterodera trifolii]|uniref:Uncharacterized protein n=1 Tax=Heterodera trifolii TaxID=157864 RepID=A0ABD2I4K1_9BILA
MTNSYGKMKTNKRKEAENMKKIYSEIETIWNKNFCEICTQIETNAAHSVERIYKFWHKLAKLFNKISFLKKCEKFVIIYEELTLEKTNGLEELLWRAKDQLLPEHVKNVIRLTTMDQSAKCQNALSRFLANSLGQMKSAKHRLYSFFSSQFIGMTYLDKFLQESSNFAQVFRCDLTPSEISQLQVKYYLNYMDSDSETDVHTRALFMVDYLAFYDWFKNRINELPKTLQPSIEQLLFQIELYLDFHAGTTESAIDKSAKMEHKQKMVALKTAKDAFFPDEVEVIVVDGRGENPANLLAIAMELMIMHREIINGLIENEEHFLDKVKNNAKRKKQHGNENNNNEKKDEEEKGEGGEKGDEKGREKGSEKEDKRGIAKEDESIGEEGENGRNEKKKEDKKGREKVEQKEGSEEDEKEKEDKKGGEKEDENGIEKEDESIGEKGKKENEDKKRRKKEDESIGEEGENGKDEKEKEDKKEREKVEQKGGSEEEEKEKGVEKGREKVEQKGGSEEEEKEKGVEKGREKVEQKGGSEEDENEKEDKKGGEKEDEKGRVQVEQKGGSEGDKKEKGGEDGKGLDEKEKEDKKEKGGENGQNGRDEKEKGDKNGKRKVEQKGGGDEKGSEGAESDLISCYKYLMCADQPISKSDQKLLLVNATYYKMKSLINQALSTAKQIKNGVRKNSKLRRMAKDIEMTAQKAHLFEKPKNFDDKLVKICYLVKFWTYVISNRNLYKESDIWRTFLAYRFGGEENAKRSQQQQVPMEGEHKWDNNSICEKSEKVSELLQHLLKSSTSQTTHEFVLYNLLDKNKEFAHFIYYSLDKMPRFKKMVQFEKDDEIDRLYLALFASADSPKVFEAEINLGIKMLESQINKLEQMVRNSLNYSEIMIARAKLRATAAVQLHFRHDEKFRIICGQIAYVSYLSQKMDHPFTLWNSPTKCFSISREDTLSLLRVAHRECHWDFVINRLAGPEENSFLSTVRPKRGTLALLEKLIGGPLLNMLWKTNEAPAKFMDENCNALLDANMAAASVADRMGNINSADLIVWMQWFQSAHKGKARHSTHREYIWLYARVFYDNYGNGFDKYFEAEFSRIEVMMEKITQMHTAAPAFALQKGICCKLPEKWHTIIKEGTINESILEVIESEEGKGRKMGTNEFLQQLHFDVISGLCQNIDQSDEIVQRNIENIIKMLKQCKDSRRNLKRLLNKEQIKEIFQLIGIPFDEKEFECTDQQMAFLSVEKIEDQQMKKRKKNRRKKNGQKLGMNEENESEQTEEKTENHELFDKMIANDLTREFAVCLSPSFPKLSQQLIRDEFDEQNSQKLEQFVAEMAINGKTADGMPRKKRDKRIKAALATIKRMAGKWSADQAKLFISGSFLLELNTIDSDFDLICVVPGKIIKKEHFLGEQNEICVEKKCESGEAEKDNLTTPKSFYCHLCENEKVNDLLKISHGQLMMLKFTFDGIDFDISFVAIPKLEALAQRITDGTLRNYYENFIAINCIGQDKITMQNFCQFVETRIRIQLAYDISQRGTTTNWHIYPALYQETCQITQKLEGIPNEIRSDYHHCKLWLIGTDQQLMDANEKRLTNGQLLNFDWAIKRDFLKFNGKLSNKLGTDDINEFTPDEQPAVGQLATKERKVVQSLTDDKVEHDAIKILKDSFNGSVTDAPVSAEEIQKLRAQFDEMPMNMWSNTNSPSEFAIFKPINLAAQHSGNKTYYRLLVAVFPLNLLFKAYFKIRILEKQRDNDIG